jgi:hypothetical protein
MAFTGRTFRACRQKVDAMFEALNTIEYQAPAAYLRHLYMVDDMVSARMVDTEQLNNSNAASLKQRHLRKKVVGAVFSLIRPERTL